MPRILISGAGVAGPALALHLAGRGWDVTVVERADRLRDGGQNIDIRGAAREVLRRSDLEDAVRAAGTGELGTEFVDARGRAVATFPAGRSDTAGATAEVEILRGELARILYERMREHTEYVFGDRIRRVEDRTDGVTVGFERGPDRTFDLVVVAEGLRSRTRDLVFPEGVDVRHLGAYIAYLALPRVATDTRWWRWYNAPGGRSVSLRPDNVGTTRPPSPWSPTSAGSRTSTPGSRRSSCAGRSRTPAGRPRGCSRCSTAALLLRRDRPGPGAVA